VSLSSAEEGIIASHFERMKKWVEMEEIRNQFIQPSLIDKPKHYTVEKLNFGTLNYYQFINNYSNKRIPVIFQNAMQEMITV